MSGRKIDDHKFWAGSSEEGTVFPKGAKMKAERSGESEGDLGSNYPDTTDDIRRDQDRGADKIRSRPVKPGNRY